MGKPKRRGGMMQNLGHAMAFSARIRKIDPGNLVEGTVVMPSSIVEVARLQSREGFAHIKS